MWVPFALSKWCHVLLIITLLWIYSEGRINPDDITECEGHVVRLQNICYDTSEKMIRLNWDQAKNHCLRNRMILPSVNHVYQLILLRMYAWSLLIKDFWLGARRVTGKKNIFVDQRNRVTDTARGRWAAGEPNGFWRKENCLMSGGAISPSWYDKPCNSLYTVICEHTACPRQCIKKATPRCRNGGVKLGDSCFYFGVQKVTWAEAEKNCKGRNMYLARIDSQQKHSAVTHYMRQLTIANKFSVTNFWIGIKKSGGRFRYTAGDPDNIKSFWAPKQPMGRSGAEICVLYNSIGHRPGWSDLPCKDKHGFICQDCPECKTGDNKGQSAAVTTAKSPTPATYTSTSSVTTENFAVVRTSSTAPVATIFSNDTDIAMKTEKIRSGHIFLNDTYSQSRCSLVPTSQAGMTSLLLVTVYIYL